ncbi:UDP-N-acetylmuramoyl-L-alanine--D-glutamate ligase [Pseudoluteimonas lycopersici]|uniref:UDP-N-acetylmuramoyl-L-alanine--L-glutamate ligase n=1 Tax=Pseudoluteimonas lycopersici TaxID=1324796 RepID=A0A516V8C2_9GAMM|nr:UDP-N-acetylmuramoyl-L-alanine--D-glutamate ligase [Lysobacter lycopersici]
MASLARKRVALWGWGREGRAAYHAIRARLPQQPLALFCSETESAGAAALNDPLLSVEREATGGALSAFDVVIKSPGISPYKPEAVFAAERGTRFIGGTALWFAEHADDGTMARTFCVTGTKGKSTTTALLARLLRAAGLRTALAGNIGLPLLELIDESADAWAIELSSYQTRDVADSGARLRIAVVTNIHPEHLDWHGSERRYVDDKLALLTEAKPQIAVLNAEDPVLAALALPDSEIHWYGHARGWHLRGDALHRGDAFVMDTSSLPLPGRHNRGNLCAVLTALEAFGLDAVSLAPHAASFQPLPNRLQPLGERDGIRYVNDSISTTPHATLAALALYAHRQVAVLVGGHDRGLPWEEFADAMHERAPHAIVTLGHGVAGQNGDRIHALLSPMAAEGRFALSQARDLEDALAQARAALPDGGVVLLSPGAPSFGLYRDYVARGRHFAELAGFDPDSISGIAGMGIA